MVRSTDLRQLRTHLDRMETIVDEMESMARRHEQAGAEIPAAVREMQREKLRESMVELSQDATELIEATDTIEDWDGQLLVDLTETPDHD